MTIYLNLMKYDCNACVLPYKGVHLEGTRRPTSFSSRFFSKLEWEAWRQKNPPSLSFSSLSVSLSPLSAKWNGREKRKSAAVGPKFTDRVRNRESDIHPTLDSALDKGHSNLELGGGRILRSLIFSKTKWKRRLLGSEICILTVEPNDDQRNRCV